MHPPSPLNRVEIMQLRIKNSFIPWSFPEIVAKEEGFFAAEGIDVTFYALDPSDIEPGNKVQWYGGLGMGGRSTPTTAARGPRSTDSRTGGRTGSSARRAP